MLLSILIHFFDKNGKYDFTIKDMISFRPNNNVNQTDKYKYLGISKSFSLDTHFKYQLLDLIKII